jgi:DMSO/TMAO reductase YedYZ molybdopterin-dependent catalytic subunit
MIAKHMGHNLTLKERKMGRRRFFGMAAVAAGVAATSDGLAAELVEMPFENGTRELVRYPQKRPLIRLTSRPPQLETPMSIFNEGLLTPNDAFFVRYHLAGSPPAQELLGDDAFTLSVAGAVERPLELKVADLKRRFELSEVVAVNQCSGTGRGLFVPRVPGGQSGNGAMGCARWRGVRLADVLKAAGVKAGAKQVLFDGMDKPPTGTIPDFVKVLEADQALDPDILLATEMNGEPLPWLNGFPLRLVVPGHYGTYWIKHLHRIIVLDEAFQGYWMDPAYRIPDDPCAHVAPGSKPRRTIPISRFNVRSFITSLATGSVVREGEVVRVRGFAFDGGAGIREVVFSEDEGRNWRGAELSPELGRFGFREWTLGWKPAGKGARVLWARATNRLGESQPLEPLWNPAGYMRNVVEPVKVMIS